MPNEPRVTTPYAEYVFSNVSKAARLGQGTYTYKELAGMVGLKPTQHFKRRINQMVARGVLVLIPSFTPRGNIENRFMTDSKFYLEEITK